jgi:succinate dehydrogenase / fumarate reductase cytochrome b subunit
MIDERSPMKLLPAIFKSSIGKKFVMAASGLALFVFVVAHMLGNLQIFLGPEPLNAYGEFLKSKPSLLWTARLGLLLMVVLHIVTSVQLTLENRAARPVGYATAKPPAASFASRTLFISGLIIFAFIVYHLMQFTLGITNPEFMLLEDAKGRHDVYRMSVAGFSQPLVSIFYILAMGLLCLHLSHGVSSWAQSLGWRSKNCVALDRFAKGAALVIFLGNCSIPLAVLTKIVR